MRDLVRGDNIPGLSLLAGLLFFLFFSWWFERRADEKKSKDCGDWELTNIAAVSSTPELPPSRSAPFHFFELSKFLIPVCAHCYSKTRSRVFSRVFFVGWIDRYGTTLPVCIVIFGQCTHTANDKYDNTVTFALKMAMLTSQINGAMVLWAMPFVSTQNPRNVHFIDDDDDDDDDDSCCVVVSKTLTKTKRQISQKFTATGGLYCLLTHCFLWYLWLSNHLCCVVTVRGCDRRSYQRWQYIWKEIKIYAKCSRAKYKQSVRRCWDVFHDAGTFNKASNGMNGSVLYELDDQKALVWSRTETLGSLRRDESKRFWWRKRRRIVSWLHSLRWILRGWTHRWFKILESVPLGRNDASSEDPEHLMPIETLRGNFMRVHFQSLYGFSSQEMIALSGAHTIGQKGFGDPYTFDNEYFVTLKKDPWNLPNLTKDELEMNEHIGLLSDR